MPCAIMLQRIIGRLFDELFYIVGRVNLHGKTATVHNRHVVVCILSQRYDISQFTVPYFDSHFIAENQDIKN